MKYLIYSKAQKLFEETGINQRIKKLNSSQDVPNFFSHYFDDELWGIISEMKESGHIQSMPKTDETVNFRNFINDFHSNSKELGWSVNGEKRIVSDYCKLEQMVLFLGYPASHILTPDEIWDYKKFGFSSISEFLGSLGAQIIQSQTLNSNKGLIWKSSNGKKSLENEITGSCHADLRVYQTDISEYKTIDPFGNKTLFRQINFNEDQTGIIGYHSEEINLLVGVLKYINQEKIDSKIIKNPNIILDLLKNKNSSFLTCSDQYLNSSIRSPKLNFVCFDELEHPKLDKNLQYFQMPRFHLSMESEGHYSMFVDSNKNLVFSQMDNLSETGKLENIACRFTTNDVDKLIEGIFTQAITYAGRTHPSELLTTFNYYLENFQNL